MEVVQENPIVWMSFLWKLDLIGLGTRAHVFICSYQEGCLKVGCWDRDWLSQTLALNLDFVPCHFHRLSLSSLTLISSLSSVSDTSSVPLQNLLASLSPEPLITLHPWLLPTQAGPRPAWQGHNLAPPASVPWGRNPWQAWGFGLRGIHAETILSMCPWSVY